MLLSTFDKGMDTPHETNGKGGLVAAVLDKRGGTAKLLVALFSLAGLITVSTPQCFGDYPSPPRR